MPFFNCGHRKECHPDMNPYGEFRKCSNVKEQLSRAIVVGLDHTGSMDDLPELIRKKLNRLFNAAVKKGVIPHPQILFTAVGDFNSDNAPLQVGRFHGNVNDLEKDLEKIFCEGGGGAQGMESYELLLYFATHRVRMDCLDKWGEKGFLFIIGDEKPYESLIPEQVKETIGDENTPSIPIEHLLKVAQEMYHIFFIVPKGHENHSGAYDRWVSLLGKDHVAVLQNPNLICELIVSTIALYEGYLDANNYKDSLTDLEVQKQDVESVSQALVPIAQADELRHRCKTVIKTGGQGLPAATTKKKTVKRL